jgi:hypothetical protein
VTRLPLVNRTLIVSFYERCCFLRVLTLCSKLREPSDRIDLEFILPPVVDALSRLPSYSLIPLLFSSSIMLSLLFFSSTHACCFVFVVLLPVVGNFPPVLCMNMVIERYR